MTNYLIDNMGAGALPIEACSAEGPLVWDTRGRSFWDFYGGHAVTLLGQAHERWIEAIAQQARQLSFFTTAGPVPIRNRAAERLCRFTGMDRVFFVNSGAEANEAALKMARKATGRNVVVAMESGFHGRTMGALGATWKYREQHALPHGETRFVPFGDLAALEAALDETVAAVITEPVQGIGGIVEPPVDWLRGVADAVHAVGGLLIVDEVQSGIGRMGVPVASDLYGVRGDIMTVGKGLGGGFPVAACLVREQVAKTVRPGEHGTTFGGAPLACAAVDITLDIIEKEQLMDRALEIGETLRVAALGTAGVEAVRGQGAWIGLVLDRPAKPVKEALLEAGYLVGTAADPNVLRLSPPAIMPLWTCKQLIATLDQILSGSQSAVA